MNTINIATALDAPPLSLQRFIGLSALHIVNAGVLANDRREAVAEARRIYRRDCRGMWQRVQADARRVLDTANRHGLTLERPYCIVRAERETVLCTVAGDGALLPAISFPDRRPS